MERKLIWSCDIVFVKDQTIEDIEKVKRSNTQINNGFIDFDPIPTTKDVSQQDEDREDVDESSIIDNANRDSILPHKGIELGEHTSLQEALNQQTRWSTKERQPSMTYPSLHYVVIFEEGEP